jgi:nucleoside-diphosphate-sugar epimerase
MVRSLLAANLKDIRVFDIAPFDYAEKSQVEVIIGDIRDPLAVNKAMKDIDFVIHTAAALPLYKKEDIFSTDVNGTKILLEAAFHNNVERFVHVSSTAVYGIPDHHPLLESDQLIGVGPYGKAKIHAEEECLKARSNGMCVPILRPKSFIGPERLGVFALLYDWAKTGHNFPMIGFGNNRYQLLDVEDLCAAIISTLSLDATLVNDTFNIGAKEYSTFKEDLQAVLDRAGHGKKIIGFPAWPMIWTLRLLETFHLSPLYKWVYETACEDSFVSIEKAERILNFKPKYSNKAALIRNFEWYLKNVDNIINTSGISHRAPWKQGILRLAKALF